MRWSSVAIRLCAALALWAGVSAAPSPALAGGNDIRLYRLTVYEAAVDDHFVDEKGFERLAMELGVATAPKLLAPADTLGMAGFEVSFNTSTTDINEKEPYWKVVEDNAPPNALTVWELRFRKGLPAGFDIGFITGNVTNSNMLVAGGELRWSWNEGIWYTPDFTLRAFGNRIISVRDLWLVNTGGDVVLSKRFGLMGVGTLTPYIGGQVLVVLAKSRLLDPTPGTLSDGDERLVLFSQPAAQDMVVPGYEFGVRYQLAMLTLSGEAMMTTKSTKSFSFKLGLSF